jgi:large subunit ribosomal protein L25
MVSAHTLKAQRRERLGSRYAKRDRAAGRLPAVLYGHGQPPVSIALEAKEALKFFHQGEKVFTIELSGEGKGQTVILKDLQFDYLGTNVVHVDLARVDLDEEITANVHVNLIGEAIGLKKAGAILTHPITQIAIKCTVRTLPDHIDVDISGLDMNQEIKARDVKLTGSFKLASDPDAILAAISEVKEEVVVAEAAAVEGAAAGPEVITAKKEDPAAAAAGGDKGKAAAPAGGDKGKAPAGGGDKKEKK